MKVLIQLVLILAVVVVMYRMTTARGARTQAIRRLGMLAFALFAIWSILFPRVWTWMAHQVGVGRGTDLVLYALVVAFLGFMMGTQLRFRDSDIRFTRLARRIALDEAARRHPEVADPGAASSPLPADVATVMRPQDHLDDEREAPEPHDPS